MGLWYLKLRSINSKKKAGEFMAYALQDEKVNETIKIGRASCRERV